MVTELWNAVKDKNWLLAMRNQASFPEGIWQFPGAGSYLGPNGGGGVGYGPGADGGRRDRLPRPGQVLRRR